MQPAPEQITMTMEFDGLGDAIYLGCMAGLARRAAQRGEYWTEYTLQANGRLCEAIRRRYDQGHTLGTMAAVF